MATATANAPAFTHEQEAVLTAIAEGASKIDAARRVGVHRTTIHTWEQRIPGYRDAIRDAQADYREHLESEMRDLSTLALQKLKELLVNPRTSPSVMFRAITFILKRGSKPSEKWALPEALSNAAEQAETDPFDIRHNAAKNVENVEFDAQSNRRAGVENVEFPASATPRNAQCPCGSGQKYKRCCGKNAPPHLHGTANAA